MAHRKRLFRGRVACGVLGGLTVGWLLAGSIFISNETTALRARIAVLEAEKEFLEADTGNLMTRWNAATTAPVILRRARTELGLVAPENPDLVLVCRDAPARPAGSGVWRKFLSRFGGGTEARAAEDPTGLVTGAMVSLTPRTNADADGVRR
jgi:hypothetical protein